MSVPTGGNYYQSSPQINFDWLSQAWTLFRAQTGAWIGAVLIYLLIALALDIPLAFVTGYAQQFVALIAVMRDHTSPPPPQNTFANYGHDLVFGLIVGVVNGVLVGGLYRMAIRQGRGETVTAGDIFSALDVALPLIVVSLVTQVLTVIGSYLCLLPGLIVGGLFMFAPLLVVDRKLGPVQAITESISLLKSQWLMASLFFFVATLIGSLGSIVCGVGILATYPILLLSVGLAYLNFTQPTQPLPSGFYGTPQPGVWPPPPVQGQEPPLPPNNLPPAPPPPGAY